VAQTATLARSVDAIAAPATRNRIAAQITNGNTRKAKTSSRTAPHGPKIAADTANTVTKTKQSSNARQPRHVSKSLPGSSRGVNTITPIASPSHHTRQADPNPDQASACATVRLVTPSEAEMVVANTAPMLTNRQRSFRRSRVI